MEVGLDSGHLAAGQGACRYRLPLHTADISDVSRNRHVCRVTQQTCLLCDAADISAVSHDRHVCCAPRHSCLRCHTVDFFPPCPAADTFVLSHSRRVCGFLQLTCPLCCTAVMSAVWRSRRLICATHQTCQLWRAAGISAIWHSRIPSKLIHYLLPDFHEQPRWGQVWSNLKRGDPRLLRGCLQGHRNPME